MTEACGRRTFLRVMGGATLALPWASCARGGGSVVVVGAGLSGVTAAMLLEERGLTVTVVEARDRVGGRVFTLDDVPGRPDAGGPVIGASYDRLVKLAKSVGTAVQPVKSFESSELEHVNGEHVIAADWAAAKANRLEGAERQVLPGLLVGYYCGKNLPLDDGDAWFDPRFASFDIALSEYVKRQGASAEAMRLMDVASNNNGIDSTSALWALRDAQRRRDTKVRGMLEIPGGNSRLVEAMAAYVKGPIHKSSPVTAITSTTAGVQVQCANGASHAADYGLITVPFSVLRGITIDPPLQGAQKEAVEQIPYTAITQFFLVPKRPFWDDDKLPPLMWTDTPIERIFPQRDTDGRILSLTCWVDGANAIRLDGMPEAEQVAFVKAELARIRPSTKDNVDVARVVAWGRDPFSKGAYANFHPGQVTRLRPTMVAPWHRLHFAGEHAAIAAPGMEGAIESAERAAEEIIARASA